MAYGLHWEWRGFGSLAPGTRSAIEALTPQFATPAQVTDEYLWIPGVRVNAKLRSTGAGTLKLKRLRESDATSGVELWEERAEEEYAFPVAPASVSALAEALALRMTTPTGPTSREHLLELLKAADSRVTVVTVQKLRRARIYPVGKRDLVIEIAEIESPESITTVGVEDQFRLSDGTGGDDLETARRAVADAVSALGLSRSLTKRNYVDATTVWAEGQEIGA